MQPDEHRDDVEAGVTAWVEQAAELLRITQGMLEGLQQSGRPPGPGELAAILPLVRECRAQTPNPETVRTWVRTLTEDHATGPRRPAEPGRIPQEE